MNRPALATGDEADGGHVATTQPADAGQQFWYGYTAVKSGRNVDQWRKIDAATWEETWTGNIVHHAVAGRSKPGDRVGTIVERLPRHDLQVLIPDVGSGGQLAWRQPGKTVWNDMGKRVEGAVPTTAAIVANVGAPASNPLGNRQSVIGFHPDMLSGLVLAGSNHPRPDDDGILTAFEVSGLDLSGVDMAVLSACDTGLGRRAGGEGMLGLQRAFQVAGARTVVASLWKVPDAETRQLRQVVLRQLVGQEDAEASVTSRGAALDAPRRRALRKRGAGRQWLRAGDHRASRRGTFHLRVEALFLGGICRSGDWR